MKKIFIASVFAAISSLAWAQEESLDQQVHSNNYQIECDSCGCPKPVSTLKEGWYKVTEPSNYFAQYIRPTKNCDGSLQSLKVWYKNTSSAPQEFTCNGNTCTAGAGPNCRTITIQSEASYIFQDGSRQPSTFNFM